MSDIVINENLKLNMRKEQAIQLNINIQENMTLESIEKEIIIRLESGMQDLKDIVNEISLLES